MYHDSWIPHDFRKDDATRGSHVQPLKEKSIETKDERRSSLTVSYRESVKAELKPTGVCGHHAQDGSFAIVFPIEAIGELLSIDGTGRTIDPDESNLKVRLTKEPKL